MVGRPSPIDKPYTGTSKPDEEEKKKKKEDEEDLDKEIARLQRERERALKKVITGDRIEPRYYYYS